LVIENVVCKTQRCVSFIRCSQSNISILSNEDLCSQHSLIIQQLLRRTVVQHHFFHQQLTAIQSNAKAKTRHIKPFIFAAMKILMVCLGNICRSPLAEGILRHKVLQAGLDWQIDSAGTAGHMPGCPPHKLSQKIAHLNGFDICDQVCRQLVAADADNFDKIYVMDRENYNDVKRIFGNKWNAEKIDMLMNEVYAGKNKDVPDPWYGGEGGYHLVYDMINQACDAIIKKYGTQKV
jgi:protein-tyrosine phosphatase